MGLNLTKTNLSELAESGYEFELKIPGTGEKTGSFVTVRGNESKAVKAYGRKKYNEIQTREQVAARKGKTLDPMTLEDAEDLAIESAIIRIIGWSGIEENDPKDETKVISIPFTRENAERILREHSWIRDQIMEAASDVTNFLGT